MTTEKMIPVARVGRLFGKAGTGGVALTLYDTFPQEFDPAADPLFVEIDSLAVPLWCDRFERRGVSGANVDFADFDTSRRAEPLIGRELYMDAGPEEDDEFCMEDLIGFTVEAGDMHGTLTDYYDSDMNPLFGVDFGSGERLIPAVEEFIAHIDFDGRHMKMVLPEGLADL